MDLIITLSGDDRNVLIGALYTAIDSYEIGKKAVAEIPGHERMEEAFERQAENCRSLIKRIEP